MAYMTLHAPSTFVFKIRRMWLNSFVTIGSGMMTSGPLANEIRSAYLNLSSENRKQKAQSEKRQCLRMEPAPTPRSHASNLPKLNTTIPRRTTNLETFSCQESCCRSSQYADQNIVCRGEARRRETKHKLHEKDQAQTSQTMQRKVKLCGRVRPWLYGQYYVCVWPRPLAHPQNFIFILV